MAYLLLLALLLASPAQLRPGRKPSRQPDRQAQYPHFRPAEKRKLHHYQPKTWREKAPAPKPHGSGPT